MSSPYIAPIGNPRAIHVNLDFAPPELSVKDAVTQICLNDSSPKVTWVSGILQDPTPLLRNASTEDLYGMLNSIANLPPGTQCTAVVFFDQEEIQAEEQSVSVRGAITRTIHKLRQAAGGRTLILVTKGPEAAQLIINLNLQLPIGRFPLATAEARGPRGSLTAAVAADAPKGINDPWDWADDEGGWTEAIDRLTQDDVNALVRTKAYYPAIRRVRAALSEMSSHFENRERAAEMLVACAMARVNVVLLGRPGTAKSQLVRTFAKTLGVRSKDRPISEEQQAVEQARNPHLGGVAPQAKRRMFEYLLTRYTTPEELFGGADINLLLSTGLHGRRTQGMLPQADIAFLDEIFKANGAILNTLLSLTNEKLFYNLGQAFKVKLAFVVGASNETPAEAELGALYDRFPLRVPCYRVPREVNALKKVVKHAHEYDCKGGDVPRVACMNDVRLLTKIVQSGVGGGTEPFEVGKQGDAFSQEFFSMFMYLCKEYSISDRTPVQILRVCRALALLDDDDGQMLPRHLRAWAYVAGNMERAVDLQQDVKLRIQGVDEGAFSDPKGLFDPSA